MSIRSRVVAAALVSAAVVPVGLASTSQAATTALATQPATASVCHYTDSALSSITAAGPRVKEQTWFRTHHVRQHARYQASLQSLSGTKWSTLSATTKRRTPLLASTTTTMPRLSLVRPMSAAGRRYRVTTVIRWIGRGGAVVKTQRMVLARYTSGTSSCVTTGSGTTPTPPSVSVAASTGTFPAGSTVGGTFTVSGMTGSGTAYVNLWGPAPCPNGCAYDGGPQQFQVSVPGDGTYGLPAGSLPASGYYKWDVDVVAGPVGSGDVWSGDVVAKEAAGWSITSPSGDPSLNRSIANGPVQVRLDFGGLHYTSSVDVTPTIWGPYDTQAAADAAACSGTQHVTGGTQTFQIGPGGLSHVVTDDLHAYSGKFFRMSATAAVTSNTDIESLATAKVCSTTFHVIP